MDSRVWKMKFSRLTTYIPRVSSRFLKLEDFFESLVEQMTVNRFFGFFMTAVHQIQSLYAFFSCRFPANFRRRRPSCAKIGNRKPLIRRNWRCKIVKIDFLRFWSSKSLQISKNRQTAAKLANTQFFDVYIPFLTLSSPSGDPISFYGSKVPLWYFWCLMMHYCFTSYEYVSYLLYCSCPPLPVGTSVSLILFVLRDLCCCLHLLIIYHEYQVHNVQSWFR